MNKKSIIFAGTDKIGAFLLEKLSQNPLFEIKQVVTQVDRPSGRKMKLTPSDIKVKAEELNLEIFQPENINSYDSIQFLKSQKADLMLVFAYGQLFKEELLNLFEFNCINVHTSLLPKYRGASPIQSSLLNQDQETGITLIKMVKAMDAGPIFSVHKVKIEQENAIELSEKLAKRCAEKIPDDLIKMINGEIKPVEQNHKNATYCQKIKKTDGQINWDQPAKKIEAQIRGYAGWPGTFTFLNGKRLKIHQATASSHHSNKAIGEIYLEDDKVYAQCKNSSLELIEIQIEGKKRQLAKAYPLNSGDILHSLSHQ